MATARSQLFWVLFQGQRYYREGQKCSRKQPFSIDGLSHQDQMYVPHLADFLLCDFSHVIVLNLIVTSDTSSVTLKQFTQIISLRVILQRILTMLSVHYICQSVFQMQNQLRMLRPDLEKV